MNLRYDPYREQFHGYDTAQVCLNGHPVNSRSRSSPQHNERFCAACGAETITVCSNCNHAIRGMLHGVVDFSEYHPPAFCHNCGKPFPWTESGLSAAKDLISEAEKLSADDREMLNKSLDDLVRDSQSTHVAAIRFKRLLPKAGREIAEGVRAIAVDIVSETAKKPLWPS